jgi:hypothetical protein
VLDTDPVREVDTDDWRQRRQQGQYTNDHCCSITDAYRLYVGLTTITPQAGHISSPEMPDRTVTKGGTVFTGDGNGHREEHVENLGKILRHSK